MHETPERTAVAVAERVAGFMAESEGDRFSLGLAGGSTPKTTYEALRGRATGWARVDAWLSDERWVPSDHPRSNGRMAAETLMDHVEASFHRPRWSVLLEPADAAAHYEARLRSVLAGKRPDLILLGMGDDGHTASLFPETEALEVEGRWIVANHVPQLGEDRLTATYPLLWRARLLCVIAVGEGKAQALADSLGGKTPAGRIGDGDAAVEWHVDAAAASLVS